MRVLVLLALLTPAAAGAAELALKRVMLSSAGVGYFEYEAVVDGPATLGLDVKLDQVDDVLKSLIVFDDAGGVGGIELPGRDASHSAFGDVPFGPEGLASPLVFLNSLQGVEVTVEGPRPMTGRILRAESVLEPATAPGRDAAARTRVSVLTAGGLKQFVLEEADTVQVADPELRARIARALAASRHESAQDARHITIRSAGAGHRTVRVSYVAVAPLWKASYRLVLPAPDADPATSKARLQGWATFENASGTDWSGVSLSVQYGNPVTFHQDIYRSYFVARPEVPVEVLGRLLPDVDLRARAETADAAAPPPPPPPPVQAAPAPPPQAKTMSRSAQMAGGLRRPEIAMAGAEDAAAVQEGVEETVFTIAAAVDLAAGHSASVPILDGEIPATRVALVQPDQPHPLAALRLVNSGAVSLPAGVLTLYDPHGDSPYAGDARLGGVPKGESRMVAYAQDLRTGVEWRHSDATTLASLTASHGVLTVDERQRQVTHAVITAPADAPRHVLIEVPKSQDGTLAAGFARPVEETDAYWRLAADVRPGEVKDVTYAVDEAEHRAITLTDDDEAMASVLELQDVSTAARAALQHIADLRAQVGARSEEQSALGKQRDAVDEDEVRLRANLGAVQAGDAVRTRLVRQLDSDETKRAHVEGAIAAADAAVDRAKQVLADAINELRL